MAPRHFEWRAREEFVPDLQLFFIGWAITGRWLAQVEKTLACCRPLVDELDIDDLFSPNPPKDTDGRREDSGRGWVRELQGRWPGVLG